MLFIVTISSSQSQQDHQDLEEAHRMLRKLQKESKVRSTSYLNSAGSGEGFDVYVYRSSYTDVWYW